MKGIGRRRRIGKGDEEEGEEEESKIKESRG